MSTQKTYSSEREIAELWKMFRENRRERRAMSKEADRRMEELTRRMKETDQQIKETAQRIKETDRQMKETDRQMKETDRKINKVSGDWARKWGRLVESLVEGNLIKLLNERNIGVQDTAERVRGPRNAKDKHGNIYEGRCEIDIMASNGAEAVAVEVKTSLDVEDVNNFLYKMDNFGCFFSKQIKKVYGAMAYLTVDQNADVYARKKGLFTIKATGDSAYITNSKTFQPKIFFP